MFDLGFTELLLIGIVALIVVGPKDLPGLFRNVGRFIGKAKGMAREFSSAMNDAADESGFKDATSGFSDLKKMANPMKAGLDSITDSVKEATDEFTKWSPNETTGSETTKLAEERAEAAKKIHAATAKKATERKLAQATEEAAKAASETAKPASAKPAPAKPTSAKPKPKAAVKQKPKAAAKPKAASKPRATKPKAAPKAGKAKSAKTTKE